MEGLQKGRKYLISLNNGTFYPPRKFVGDQLIGGRMFACFESMKSSKSKSNLLRLNYSYIASIDEDTRVEEIFNSKQKEKE